MENIPQNVNLGVSFILELVLLIIYGIFGHQILPEGTSGFIRVLVGILAAAGLAILWGFLFAPKALHRLQMPWLLIGKSLVMGIGVFMLFKLQHSGLAIAFLVVVILNFGLALLWGQK